MSEFVATNAPDPPPLDPKLIFLFVSYYFSAVGTVWLARKIRWKMGRTNAKVRATKSHQNFFATNALDPPHWTLNSSFGAFGIIS